MNIAIFEKGNFSFMKDKHTAEYLKNMYDVIEIQKPEIWNIIKNFQEESFMLSHEKWITDLANICDPGHSGASFYICLRHMEFIVKHSWDKYVMNFTSSDNNP